MIFTLVSSVITIEASEMGSNVIENNTIDTGQEETDLAGSNTIDTGQVETGGEEEEPETYEKNGHTFIKREENQVFKLKATKINDYGEQGKQVIMQLWGYNVDFSRISCKV